MTHRFDEVDRTFAEVAAQEHVPGIAYGVVVDGELVHAGGVGTLVAGRDEPPDAASVFRIASMTKSFTGAAVMLLREEGSLRLDEPVTTYAPELAGWRGPTADSPPITVRHLLSMDSGLPTDDPWADRHIDATREEMDALFAAGSAFAWPPGIAFEYSNLGWGLIGRIVENIAGTPVQRIVEERLLRPLDMASTAWSRDTLPGGVRIAEGYRWQDETFVPEDEPLGDGQIAPMGGIWSTVEDLSKWVAFFLDAFPPRDEPDDGPLARAARREMQQLRRVDEVTSVALRRGGAERVLARGYGIGLAVTHDVRLGTMVGHSGGFPGFGSHMRWLPDRGLGLVALGNVTYAPMSTACLEAIERLADADALPPRRRVTPAPELTRAAAKVRGLLESWDDAEAAALFADNVFLDESRDRRKAAATALRHRLGALEPFGEIDAETPLRGTFTLGSGRARVEVMLDAAVPPRVQTCDITVDPPVITDPAHLTAAAGTAYVAARPSGSLAELFESVQTQVRERLGGESALSPRAHVTFKAFGSAPHPVDEAGAAAIADVARAWAEVTPPLTLTAEALEVMDEEQVPYIRLRASDELRRATDDLRERTGDAGLPPAESDRWGGDAWIFHLSLAYPSAVPADRWSALGDWIRGIDPGGASSVVKAADLLWFDGGPERWIGRYAFDG